VAGRHELPEEVADRSRFGWAAPDRTADGVGGELQQGLVTSAAADYVQTREAMAGQRLGALQRLAIGQSQTLQHAAHHFSGCLHVRRRLTRCPAEDGNRPRHVDRVQKRRVVGIDHSLKRRRIECCLSYRLVSRPATLPLPGAPAAFHQPEPRDIT